MSNLKLRLEYDGSQFYGWQCQPKLRTVQGEVERALEILLREKLRVNVAGRTDTGVHARGQIINFHTSSTEINPERFSKSLNGILPHDVVVKSTEIVSDEFHARYDAQSRQYSYILSRYPVAVGRGYSYFVKFPIDLDKMREASKCLLGLHNFRAFCCSRTKDPHYLSRVEFIRWRDLGEKVVVKIRAKRFLRHMVRIIVGTLLNVGRGKLAPEEVLQILENQKRVVAAAKTPPHALFLDKVTYP